LGSEREWELARRFGRYILKGWVKKMEEYFGINLLLRFYITYYFYYYT